MLGVPAASLPPPWQQGLLRGVACLAPALPVLGGNQGDLSVQYRDPVRRDLCARDELQYQGAMRLATAAACLDTAAELRGALEEVTAPWLCLAAGREAVVDPAGPRELLARSSTPPAQRKLVVFPEALHGLFCEPEPDRGAIEAELLAFVAAHANPPPVV